MKEGDIPTGSHFWATSNGELLVILMDGYRACQVCGAWECGISFNSLIFIEFIKCPDGYQDTKLYYC